MCTCLHLQVTSKGVLALAERCRALQDVSLRRLTKVDSEAVGRLAENGALRSLCLSGMPQVGGQGGGVVGQRGGHASWWLGEGRAGAAMAVDLWA